MVVRLQVKNIKDERYLSGILDILNRHYGIRTSFEKPRFSRTYYVLVEGKGEDSCVDDFRAFASTVGWTTERI